MKAFINVMYIVVIATWAGCAPPPQGIAQSGGFGMPSTGTAAGQIPAASTLSGQVPVVSGAAAGVPGSVAGTVPGSGLNLTNILVQQLGVTPAQATGGAGSLFSTAKQTMNPSDFAQVSSAIPGMSQYLAAAPAQAAPTSGTAGLLNAASGALGGSNSTLGTAASLAGSFQSLGLNSGMVSQFIPIVLQYVQTTGGSTTMGLLRSALLH